MTILICERAVPLFTNSEVSLAEQNLLLLVKGVIFVLETTNFLICSQVLARLDILDTSHCVSVYSVKQ